MGDLPDADVKPPDNVLFVCKLNPVTTSEDLELIFSRFGEVVRADVIKDWKTGESLCYAFIEFATREACQEAYFKMENVLIDDRRIHVDFSQSVSKQFMGPDGRTIRQSFNFWARNAQPKEGSSKLGSKQEGQRVQLKESRHKSDNYKMVFDEDSNSSRESKRRKTSHQDSYGRKSSSDSNERRSHDDSREKRRYEDSNERRRHSDSNERRSHDDSRNKRRYDDSRDKRRRDDSREKRN